MLLALLLGVGLVRWSLTERDDCTRFLNGDPKAPSSEVVVTGTRTIVVPCRVWLPRQPEWVQILCLLDLVLWVVFVLNGAADVRTNLARRRRGRAVVEEE